jgi:signal transduction histidine kinase
MSGDITSFIIDHMECGFALLSNEGSGWFASQSNDAFWRSIGLEEMPVDGYVKNAGSCGMNLQYLVDDIAADGRIHEETLMGSRGEELLAKIERVSSSSIRLMIHSPVSSASVSMKLRARNEELRCLYGISKLIEQPGITLLEIVEGVAQLIPPSFLYPKYTICRVTLDSLVYETGSVSEQREVAAKPVIVFGKKRGEIQVSFDKSSGKISILPEEVELVEAVSGRLGKVVERLIGESYIEQLNEKLMDLREDEIKELARDLHDGPVQTLLVAKLNLMEYFNREREESLFNRSVELIDQSLAGLREICTNMYPSVLEDLGLESALKQFCESVCVECGMELVRNISISGDFSLKVKLHLYRITQELLANVMKHSGADRISYSLKMDSDGVKEYIYLSVEDNGLGFDSDDDSLWGMGHRTIRQRAEIIGCRMYITSTMGEGTLVEIKSRQD